MLIVIIRGKIDEGELFSEFPELNWSNLGNHREKLKKFSSCLIWTTVQMEDTALFPFLEMAIKEPCGQWTEEGFQRAIEAYQNCDLWMNT